MNVSSTKLFQTEIAIAEGREDKIIRMQSKYMKTGIHISLHQATKYIKFHGASTS